MKSALLQKKKVRKLKHHSLKKQASSSRIQHPIKKSLAFITSNFRIVEGRPQNRQRWS